MLHNDIPGDLVWLRAEDYGVNPALVLEAITGGYRVFDASPAGEITNEFTCQRLREALAEFIDRLPKDA